VILSIVFISQPQAKFESRFISRKVRTFSLVHTPAKKHKADNTVRECKNQYVLTYCHLLVSKGLFRSACLAFLRKVTPIAGVVSRLKQAFYV
jgi:hypothetical protein